MKLLTLILLLPFMALGQIETEWLDLTNSLENKQGGWGIGNGCGEGYFLKGKITEPLDMEGGDLLILYSHIIIEGDLINVGNLVYLCDSAILELDGGTLSLNHPVQEELKIYPNPAVDEINIKGIEVSTLDLYDVLGRRIKQYKTFGRMHKIMIDDLAPGIYILIINGAINRKIVKT